METRRNTSVLTNTHTTQSQTHTPNLFHYKVYYHNAVTNETSWTRPAEMDLASRVQGDHLCLA